MLRRHWLATVLLAVLISVASGVVIAAVAAAARADGSMERFAVRNRPFDATVFSCPRGVDPRGFESQYELSRICLTYGQAREVMSELAAMPGVEAVNVGGYYVVGVLGDEAPNGWGQIALLTATITNDPTLLVGHPKVLAGRLPSATADDEVILSERGARENHLQVGDSVALASWPLEDLDAAVNGGASPDVTTAVRLQVVGIGRFPSDLTQGEAADVSGNYFGGELHTAGLSGEAVRGFANYGIAPFVRLRDGPDGIEAFNEMLGTRWEDRMFGVDPNRTALGEGRASEQRIDTERHGMLAFAVIAGIATAGFAGLTLFRQLRREQADIRLLRPLGMDRRDLVLAGLLRVLAVAAPAGALAVVVAVALSPLGPVGLARRAEPDLGVHANAVVFVTGAAVVVVFALAVGLVAPLVGLRPEREPRVAIGRLSTWAINMGAVPRAGMSFVATSWPRIAAGVGAVALAAFVTAGIAVASLDRVVQSPERFGAWWDGAFGDYSSPEALAAGFRILSADRAVTVLAGYTAESDIARLDGKDVTLAAYWPLKGSPAPVVTRGRAPRDKGEIALGATMLRNVGANVGDTVSLSTVEGSGTFEPRALTVTGVVLFNDPITSTDSLGEGGIVTPELLDELSPAPTVPGQLLARFADGADTREVVERLARTFPGPIRAVVPPDDLRNMWHLRSLPWLFALLVGALAGVTLGHALIVTVRQRRRDLALLSVFGMSRWGIRQVTAFSTLVIVALATAMGVPAGLLCGRLVWNFLATETGLASGPVCTWFEPVGLAFVMLAAAQLVTLVATQRLTSVRPAEVLRSE